METKHTNPIKRMSLDPEISKPADKPNLIDTPAEVLLIRDEKAGKLIELSSIQKSLDELVVIAEKINKSFFDRE